MSPAIIELIGSIAAFLTTISWLPQAIKTIRSRKANDISLYGQLLLFVGIVLWLAYGYFIGSWPLIGANIVTLILVGMILSIKLRYG